MVQIRLIPAKEYLPELESIGLKFLEVIEIEGISHSVFENGKG